MAFAIWLIEPRRLFRDGLRQILCDNRFRVMLESPSMESLSPPAIQELQPDLVLVSLQTSMAPTEAEYSALAALCARWPDRPVVTLADELSVSQLVATFKAGAKGYLLKDIAPDVLRESLMLAILGESIFPSNLVPILMNGKAQIQCSESTRLSTQESEILAHLAQGESNKTIARALSLSEGTVKLHVKSLFRKIGARNRTQAAIWARAGGTSSG